MDRRALVLYLQNVRDLEVAKAILFQKKDDIINREDDELSKNPENVSYREESYPDEPTWGTGCALCIIIFLIFSAIWFIFLLLFTGGLKDKDYPPIIDEIMVISFFVGIALIFIFFVYMCISDNVDYRKECNSVNERNEYRKSMAEKTANSNIAIRNKIINDYKPLIQDYDNKIDEVNVILQNFYNMNLIPIQYRNNLAAVQYIYEFMSSTQANYSDMLINAKLEEGIQRLESKLGQIMSKLSELVYETRCMKNDMNNGLSQVINQNKQMLLSLERTEKNTYDAALYAELSANYSKANAYFSLANYLKK